MSSVGLLPVPTRAAERQARSDLERRGPRDGRDCAWRQPGEPNAPDAGHPGSRRNEMTVPAM